MHWTDVAIVGGGAIGLSIARALAQERDHDITVFEKEHHLAQHQSGRNSGVLHPGFNYPPGSRKARFATAGTARLKTYAREHDVPLEEVGVLVAATTDAEIDRLETLTEYADENGVEVELLHDREAINAREPHANAKAALWCPEAASIDARQYVHALAADIRDEGVTLETDCAVNALHHVDEGVRLDTEQGPVEAAWVVNAAGLYADTFAHDLGIAGEYRVVPFRGEYYEIVPERRDLCRSMIYPTPDPDLPFLGVHFTRRADGSVIVGPNAVLAFGREAYSNRQVNVRELFGTLTSPSFWRLFGDRTIRRTALRELHKSYRKRAFVNAAQRLVPAVQRADLAPSYAGNRAQVVSSAGELVTDPLVRHGEHSTHVLNAVSPGLTASLPFGEWVAGTVLDRLGGG